MKLRIAVVLVLFGPMLMVLSAEEVKPGKQSSLFQEYKDGPRGWTEAYHRHSTGSWMNGNLVVVTTAKEKKTFRAGYGFINRWGFADEGRCVVICSRNSHGPARIEKYEIASGKLLAECQGSKALEDTPGWAQPWCDATELAKAEKETAEKAAAEKAAVENQAAEEKKPVPGQ